jgi:ABC-type lipoprotein release transport system permease subunit
MTLLRIAVRNLLQHRKRTLLLGTAIAMVTLLLVMLSALHNGMQATMLRSATTLSTGHVNVAGFYKVTSGSASPVVTKYAELEKIVRAASPEVTSVVVRGRGFGKLVTETASKQCGIYGIDIANEKTFQEVVQVEEGRMADLAEPHTMLLFRATADQLGVKVGDNLTIAAQTFRGQQNTVDVRVVAIARDMGMMSSFSTYVPQDTVRDLYTLDPTTTGAIQVYVRDAEKADLVAGQLRTAIEGAGFRTMDKVAEPFWRKFDTVKREDWTGQKVDITTWTDEMPFIRYTLQTLQVLTAVLVSVLVVIIIIGVMNTLWISIRERTREIGTLRAIGMPRGQVLTMFVLEAAVLSLAATAVGALVASVLAVALTAAHLPVSKTLQVFLMSDHLRLLVDAPTALTALVKIAVATTLGAMFPAWRATLLRPVTAMHAEN